MPPRTILHKVIPEGEIGSVKIVHRKIARGDTDRIHDVDTPDKVPPGKYCCLYLDGQLSVADTPIEREIYAPVQKRAAGSVLIAGLGIGVNVLPLIRNRGVASVTVVEKYEGVIKLTFPYILKYLQHMGLQDKLVVICDDIHTWQPYTQKFDLIYFDIWPTTQNSNEEERMQLKQRYFKYLVPEHRNKDRWIGYWKRFEKEKAVKRKRYGI